MLTVFGKMLIIMQIWCCVLYRIGVGKGSRKFWDSVPLGWGHGGEILSSFTDI